MVEVSLVEEERKGLASDRWLRVWMATGLVLAFMLWNWAVMHIVHSAAETDCTTDTREAYGPGAQDYYSKSLHDTNSCHGRTGRDFVSGDNSLFISSTCGKPPHPSLGSSRSDSTQAGRQSGCASPRLTTSRRAISLIDSPLQTTAEPPSTARVGSSLSPPSGGIVGLLLPLTQASGHFYLSSGE